MLIEIGIIIGAAGVIYAIHYSAYGMIMQANPSSGAEILSWVAMTVFIVSYAAFRLTASLRKTLSRWSNKSSKINTFAIVFALGLILVGITLLYLALDQTKWEVSIERDTVYLASATIVGLATFGSLVTVRVIGRPKTHKPRKHGVILMYGGTIVVINYHSLFMYSACCSGINEAQFIILFITTVAALVAIAFGSVLMLDSRLNEEKDPSKPDP